MLKFNTINKISILLLMALLISNLFFKTPLLYYIFLLTTWFTLTCIGSFHIRWNYHIKALHKSTNLAKKEVAITFDDGPNTEFTPKILALLERYQAKATFFCIGKQLKKHPKIVKQINKQGHIIGNHTFSHHQTFGFFKTKTVIQELKKTDAVIKNLIGKHPMLFRPPYGVTNPNLLKALKHTNHTVIGWNIRSFDTIIKNEKKIINRVKKRIQPGSIILLHDTNEKSIAVLEQLLLFLQKQNYQCVSIDTLLNTKAYA